MKTWTIYTSRGGPVAGRQAVWSPYVGMTSSLQACQGTRARNHASVLGVLQPPRVPTDPLPVTGSRAAAFSPPCCLKILWVPVPLVPQLSRTGTHTRVLSSASSLALPHTRGSTPWGGPQTLSHQGLWVSTPLDGENPVTFPPALVQWDLLLFSPWAGHLCAMSPALTVRHTQPDAPWVQEADWTRDSLGL